MEKVNYIDSLVSDIVLEANAARQASNTVIQNYHNVSKNKKKHKNKSKAPKVTTNKTTTNKNKKVCPKIIDTIVRKRNDGSTFKVIVHASKHARYRIEERLVDLHTVINIIRSAFESILSKGLSQQVVVDKQSCYILPISFHSGENTNEMLINIITVSIFDGKLSYPIKASAKDTTVLNNENPSDAWEEAQWIYDNYSDKSIRGGGDPQHPNFIKQNFEFNPKADKYGLRHGMPTTYKGYLALHDKEKRHVSSQVRKKTIDAGYNFLNNSFLRNKYKNTHTKYDDPLVKSREMDNMWTDYFNKKENNMKENKQIIRLNQKDLNEMINATVKQLIKEGVLDNVNGTWERFSRGYMTPEGQPQSIDDVFTGNGWKIIKKDKQNGAMFYYVSRTSGLMGNFYGLKPNNLVEDLNVFLGGNYAQYLGKDQNKTYIEIFKIS
jgi:hypothetical protein